MLWNLFHTLEIQFEHILQQDKEQALVIKS